MALSYSDKEAGIQEALGAWQTNPERSIADIAREFGVSLWALRRRLYGVPSKIEGGGQNKKLTPDGEQAIIQHIELLEDFGIALRPKFFRSIANSILRTNHIDSFTSPLTVGINWPANFIKRYPELYK
jgi:transposase-like protein